MPFSFSILICILISCNPINSLIGALQINGRHTDTLALIFGSPAVNTGNNTDALATDQRHYACIVGGIIDIEAFEFVHTKSRKRVRFF